jgi:hypothetical protein
VEFQILADQQKDVVDVDLDLLDQLDLEDDVVVDGLLVGLRGLAEVGVQVEVEARLCSGVVDLWRRSRRTRSRC